MIEVPAGDDGLDTAGCRAFPAFHLQTLAQTSSTQDVVRSAARDGAAAGYCCLAGFQVAGRGRQDRAWSAPAGTALLASVLLRVDRGGAARVPIAAGLALRAAVVATAGCDCLVKWPNDLLIGGRKVAGILCEVEPGAPGGDAAVVVGFGVNLSVPAFPPGVDGVSLHTVSPAPPSPRRLLAATLTELAARVAALPPHGLGPLREEWMSHGAGLGEPVTAVSAAGSVSGVATGIDDDGALLLQSESGTTRVVAGDVHLRRAQPGPRGAGPVSR